MVAFCLVVEFHGGGCATNVATLFSFREKTLHTPKNSPTWIIGLSMVAR